MILAWITLKFNQITLYKIDFLLFYLLFFVTKHKIVLKNVLEIFYYNWKESI